MEELAFPLRVRILGTGTDFCYPSVRFLASLPEGAKAPFLSAFPQYAAALDPGYSQARLTNPARTGLRSIWHRALQQCASSMTHE